MILLAVDPGNEKSAALLYDTATKAVRPIGADVPNQTLLETLRQPAHNFDQMVVEKVACYGMAVGKEVFATVKWTGRFIEAYDFQGGRGRWHEVERKEVKMHLCGSMRATDSNIMTALLDRYGPGREKAVGTKKNPGPLRGIATHLWAALGVAVTFGDQQAAAASWQAKFARDVERAAGSPA